MFFFFFYEAGDSLWAKFCAIARVSEGQCEGKLLEGKRRPAFPPVSPTCSGEGSAVFLAGCFVFFILV